MQVHPDIEALRSDPALQRRCAEAVSAALAEWHGSGQVQGLRRELAAYSASGDLDACGALCLLLSDLDAAADFVGGVTRHFIRLLRANTLAEVPFRRSSGDGFSRVQLLAEGGAVLSICAFEPGDWSGEVEAVQFSDCTAHEIVVAGSAKGVCYRLCDGNILTVATDWSAGDRITRAPLVEARHVTDVERSMLTLQLTRVTERPAPSHEYRLDDAALVRRTSGDRRASEQVMALGVLGAMGRPEHCGAIADFARHARHDAEARWEAIRQLLALDAQAGFDLLAALARDPGDPLAVPACDLHTRLASQHPVLLTRQEEAT